MDSLTGLTGTVSGATGFNSDDRNIGLVPAGAYTLTVTGTGTYTGSYAFNLLNFASATAMTLGTTVNGTLSPANSTQLYQFSGTAGQVLYFRNIGFSTTDTVNGGLAYWTLYDQYGNSLFSNFSLQSDGGRVTLANTGTYTVIVNGYLTDNGTTTIHSMPCLSQTRQRH